MKKIVNLLIVFTFLLSFGTIKVEAKEATVKDIIENKLTNNEMSILYENFLKLNIDAKTSLKLVKKVNAGYMIDSMNPKYQDNGKEMLSICGNNAINRIVFPDGSVSVSTYPISNAPLDTSIMPLTITGGEYTNGGTWWTWRGRVVTHNTGLISATYFIDCSGSAYEASKITRAYDYDITAVGFNISEIQLTIPRPTVSSNSPAYAQLKFRLTNSISDGKYTLKAFMSNAEYYTKFAQV